MWITQTYLGKPDPGAKIFIYWLWEDYAGHKEAPTNIITRMQEMGRSFGDEVTLMSPQPGDHVEIGGNIKRGLWSKVAGKTPGLLLLEKPLTEIDPRSEEYIFFQLGNRDEREITKIFKEIEFVCREMLKVDAENATGWLRRFGEAIQFNPNFMGIGVDIRQLFRR